MKNILIVLLFITSLLANDSIEKYTKLGNFELNKTSLDTIINSLGKTKIIKSGDGANSSTRINYFIKKNNYYISFESGEMGGGEIITSFKIYKKAPKESYKTISKINLPLWKDLKLGIAKKRFKKIVKNLEKVNKTYFYEENRKIKSNNPMIENEDLLISLTPKFKNNKLVKIEIYKVVTN